MLGRLIVYQQQDGLLTDSEVQELDPQRRRTVITEFVSTSGKVRLQRLLEKLTSSLHLLAI